MTSDFAVVCVLHGDPALPAWLDDPVLAPAVHLVVNDPQPGRYARLPAVASCVQNARPLGFAANINASLTRLWPAGGGGPATVVCTNFDVQMSRHIPLGLAAHLEAHPDHAVVGPLLCNERGRPSFSVGGPPTAVKEFSRALGLRGGRTQAALRMALRRSPAWRSRNSAGTGDRIRLLDPGEYLPWTCLALRRATWDRVGPLDERFPLYAEDIDWGRRLSALGLTAALVDLGRVVHAERATVAPRTTAMYELSHQRLHEKYGDERLARWQSRALRLRQLATRGHRAPALDWGYLRTESSRPSGP